MLIVIAEDSLCEAYILKVEIIGISHISSYFYVYVYSAVK